MGDDRAIRCDEYASAIGSGDVAMIRNVLAKTNLVQIFTQILTRIASNFVGFFARVFMIISIACLGTLNYHDNYHNIIGFGIANYCATKN